MAYAFGLRPRGLLLSGVTQFVRLMTVVGLTMAGLGWRRAPQTVVVRLEANEFRPNVVQARLGDTIRFVNGNGGPHNVAFAADSISAAARRMLARAMLGEKLGPVSGPLLFDPAEVYAFVVPKDLPAGRYPLLCVPHMVNMRGELRVSR